MWRAGIPAHGAARQRLQAKRPGVRHLAGLEFSAVLHAGDVISHRQSPSSANRTAHLIASCFHGLPTLQFSGASIDIVLQRAIPALLRRRAAHDSPDRRNTCPALVQLTAQAGAISAPGRSFSGKIGVGYLCSDTLYLCETAVRCLLKTAIESPLSGKSGRTSCASLIA